MIRLKKINMKNKGILFISYFEKKEDSLVLKDKIMIKITRKNFEQSLIEDKENGYNHKIEYVNEKPEKFQMGTIYILKTPKGRPDYIYTHQFY